MLKTPVGHFPLILPTAQVRHLLVFYRCCHRNHTPTNEAGAVQRGTGKDTDSQVLQDKTWAWEKGTHLGCFLHKFRNVIDTLSEVELLCLHSSGVGFSIENGDMPSCSFLYVFTQTCMWKRDCCAYARWEGDGSVCPAGNLGRWILMTPPLESLYITCLFHIAVITMGAW